MGKGIGGHQRAYEGKNDEWLTPPHILKPLGHFDLDPCSPIVPPWQIADKTYNKNDNGLLQPFQGRVFMNPPYGPETAKWLKKLADHGNGIALIFARTETAMFFSHVWNSADGILFIEGRLHFCNVQGERAKHNSGGPSCLVAYGKENADCLENCGIPGKFVRLDSVQRTDTADDQQMDELLLDFT